ncbi:hypothetical protein [Streptomyces specialis]|uniref:hypothetical protein n=1 Tax=Streptomyces specialis TaxID=498367 RepID=UPI00073E3B30|nr:hypothetical protein [Streptomyces specialis]
MTQDPKEPESYDEFPDEERGDELFGEELGDEAPEADTAEQRADLLRPRDTPLTGPGPVEADPADAAEQAREVDPGDDEYR